MASTMRVFYVHLLIFWALGILIMGLLLYAMPHMSNAQVMVLGIGTAGIATLAIHALRHRRTPGTALTVNDLFGG